MKIKMAMAGILVFFLSLCGASVMAAEKIAFVNVQKVVAASEPGKRLSEQIAKSMEKDRQAVAAKEAEIKKLKDDFDSRSKSAKPEELNEMKLDYDKKVRDLRILVNDYNNDWRKRDQEAVQKLLPEIMKVVGEIGKKERYTLIIDPVMNQALYFTEGQDITGRVVEKLNRQYRVQ